MKPLLRVGWVLLPLLWAAAAPVVAAEADTLKAEAVETAAVEAENAPVKAKNPFRVSGSVQSDMLFPTGPQQDGSHEVFRTNTFADIRVSNLTFDFGARLEYLAHPLPGFEKDYKGWGPAHLYARMNLQRLDLTLGTFYEQFGSGFVLRTYEERSLGIDNALLGGRLCLRPVEGVQLKVLSGLQRHYWKLNKSVVSGADLELDLDRWIPFLAESGTGLQLGGSWVNKYENPASDVIFADFTHRLVLPAFVNAGDVRLNLRQGGFQLLLEYALKSQDPSQDNRFIYRNGQVLMLSASYSRKGMSFLLQAKRSDDFSFRSQRSAIGNSSFINHLPAFTEDHTYALAAMYPYATNPRGEWAYQAQGSYTFPRKTALGGRYGTTLKFNFSHVHSIHQEALGSEVLPSLTPGGPGTDGYRSSFWKWGPEVYYQDINLQFDKRFTKGFKLDLLYMYQRYNKTAIEGEGGMVNSHIFVAEALGRLSSSCSLRGELQYLLTPDDLGDWAFALLEFSLSPHWLFTLSDTYNVGSTHEHYPQGLVTCILGAHRLQAGWGRTRAGFNCSGGVCRYTPESKGVTLSYNVTF